MSYRKEIEQPETPWFGPNTVVVEVDDEGDIRMESRDENNCEWLAVYVDKKRARKIAIALLKAAAKS